MVNPKKLIAMARMWQKLAATGRKRISMPRPRAGVDGDACKNSASSKGHFIIYTTDGRRSAVPLAYHNTPIFQRLFRMSEDEFGLPRDGPITMPFDANFMDYIVSLLQRAVPEDLERALLFSLPTTTHTSHKLSASHAHQCGTLDALKDVDA
ncbi:hypothetical protein ACLOJK_017705 [Asimina triloba]